MRRRVVVLFPGFEALDAEAHRARFQRTCAQTAKLWGFAADTGALRAGDAPYFDVRAAGPDWETQTRFFVLDHCDVIAGMRNEGLSAQIARGFGAFLRALAEGGLVRYVRWSPTYAGVFLTPFLHVAAGLALAAALALAPAIMGLPPVHALWSVPAGCLFFRYLFLPWSERFYTLNLFALWRFACGLARLDDPRATAKLEACENGLRAALREPSDEYLIVSHSVGAALAVHALGALLERAPELVAGKRVVFATLGSGLLQCALLRSAGVLRRRVGALLRAPEIAWHDVHMAADPVHFYKAPVAAATGHRDAPAPAVLFYHIERVLTPAHYRQVRKTTLRIHRQYVLGTDMRAPYDFGLIVAGPLPAAAYADYTHDRLPPIGPDGAVGAALQN